MLRKNRRVGAVKYWSKPSGGEVIESPYLWGIKDRLTSADVSPPHMRG